MYYYNRCHGNTVKRFWASWGNVYDSVGIALDSPSLLYWQFSSYIITPWPWMFRSVAWYSEADLKFDFDNVCCVLIRKNYFRYRYEHFENYERNSYGRLFVYEIVKLNFFLVWILTATVLACICTWLDKNVRWIVEYFFVINLLQRPCHGSSS
jgi:hypothetical protein